MVKVASGGRWPCCLLGITSKIQITHHCSSVMASSQKFTDKAFSVLSADETWTACLTEHCGDPIVVEHISIHDNSFSRALVAEILHSDYDLGHTLDAKLLSLGDSSVKKATFRGFKPFDELVVASS